MTKDETNTLRPQPAEWRKGVAAASIARRANADLAAAMLLPAIREAQAEGATSLRAIADVLNSNGIRTVRGTVWTPMAVRRVLLRARD